MSNRSTRAASGPISGDAPATASRASVSRSMTSSSRPVSSATLSMKAWPFVAIPHASVVMSRKRPALPAPRAGLLGPSFDELLAVRSHPAGLGGDQPEAIDPPPAQLVGADPQRRDG